MSSEETENIAKFANNCIFPVGILSDTTYEDQQCEYFQPLKDIVEEAIEAHCHTSPNQKPLEHFMLMMLFLYQKLLAKSFQFGYYLGKRAGEAYSKN